jgi:hypothetical protein
MEIGGIQPRTKDFSGLFVWQKRSDQHVPTLAGTHGMFGVSTLGSMGELHSVSAMSTVGLQITPTGLRGSAIEITEYLSDFNEERPQATLSGVPLSADQPLPDNVRQFAATHKLTGSVAVAIQTVKHLFPTLPVEISLESDSETGETVILFRVSPPSGQDLDDLAEMNSLLHEEVFNNLPTKTLQFLSFGFRFD